MMRTCEEGVRRRGISARVLSAVTMLGLVIAAGTGVKANAADVKGAATEARSYETLYLNSATARSDAYDIVTDLRNMLPQTKLFYVPRQHAVSIYGTADEIALAKQVLAGVDRPVESYKVTYTLTVTGGGQTAETRHVAMLVASGGSAEVKQGARIPILTGTSGSGDKTDDQYQYLDLGLMIRAKLSGGQSHLQLDSRVGESQVVEERTIGGIQEPVIQQTTLSGTSTLAEGKTMSLGSLDIPASGTVGERHVNVAVMVEPAG